jgi:hypothetical protein
VERDSPQPRDQFPLSDEEPSNGRHANVSITRLMAGCFLLFDLGQCFDLPL